ncbi:MAG: Ig-like domain-containing protein, partial [Blautia sp.]
MKMLRKVLFGFCLCLMICFASTMTFHESTNVFGAIEVQAATVKLNKKTVVLNRNSFMNLKMIGTKAKVTWKSSNKKIVSVTSKGKIKGLKAGKANIYAKVNGKTYKCSVTVEDPKIVIPNSIEIAADKESGYALKGTKVALKVYGTKNKVKWSVNAFANPRDKASITSNGVVTLKQSGTIWVLAEVNGSIFCRFTIYIEDPEFDYNPDYIVAGVPYE